MLGPGDRVAGRFEIVHHAASGGMGSVFRARDVTGGPDVALKVVQASDPNAAQRMLREGAALAHLRHPHVVRYVAHGTTAAGEPFVAMEWVDGETLGRRLARERLEVRDAIAVVRRIASALGAAHGAGIVHRDVKPSNIMLAGGALDRVVLVDFGLARSLSDVSLTATGMLLGTPSYMAPEQARGGTVGPPGDVFSLGCVLYRCLAGQSAFAGEDLVVVLGKVLLDEPRDLDELVPGLPEGLAPLVRRMLAKDPERRPQGGAETEQELERIEAALGEKEPVAIATLAEVPSAPMSSPRSIGREELKIVSVLLAGSVPRGALETARAIGDRHGAAVTQLVDGTLVAGASGRATITDRLVRMAHVAIDLRTALPETRVAVATGRGTLEGAAPVGEVLVRANELLGSAEAGTAVIDRVTASLLGSRFEIGMRGAALVLVGERAGGLAVPTVLGRRSSCVGREREIGLLGSLLEQCADESRATAVLVTAPPGVGKTRLAHELGARLSGRSDPIEIWYGAGDTTSDGSPLLVLGRVLRSAAGLHAGEGGERAKDKLLARVARAVPGSDGDRIAAFLGEIVRVPFPESKDARLRAARADLRLMGDQMSLAWLDFVGAELDLHPVAIVLDDLHWGDLPTVTQIDTALRVHRDRPLFVLALARPEVEERFPRLWAERDIVTIPLRELPRRGAEQLARELLGKDAGSEAIQRIADRSAGNPLLLEELVRAGGERVGEVPDSVLAIVQARIDALSDGARRFLRAASVQGNTFAPACVAKLLGQAEDASLHELAERELVVADAASTWSFRHALVREAAYATLVEEDRLLAHRLTAEWLAAQPDHDPLAVADHFGRAGSAEAAIPHLRRAAERALEANDYAAVVALTRRATAAEGEDLGLLRLLEADAHVWLGEEAEVERCAKEARSLCKTGSKTWFLASGSLGFALGRQGRIDEVAELAREVIERPEPGMDIERAQAVARMGAHVIHAGRWELAERIFEVIDRAVLDHPDDLNVKARQLGLRCNYYAERDDLARYLESTRAAFAARDALGDVRNALNQLANLGDAHLRVGAYADAEAVLRDLVRKGDRTGNAPASAVGRHNLSRTLLERGDLDGALRTADEAVERFSRMSDRRLYAASLKQRGRVRLARNDLAGAERDAKASMEVGAAFRPQQAQPLAILVEVHARRGDVAAAADLALKTLAHVAEHGTGDEGFIDVYIACAEALRAAGDREGARGAIGVARRTIAAQIAALSDAGLRATFSSKPENRRVMAFEET